MVTPVPGARLLEKIWNSGGASPTSQCLAQDLPLPELEEASACDALLAAAAFSEAAAAAALADGARSFWGVLSESTQQRREVGRRDGRVSLQIRRDQLIFLELTLLAVCISRHQEASANGKPPAKAWMEQQAIPFKLGCFAWGQS